MCGGRSTADEGVAARADLCVWLVIHLVLMTAYAGRSVVVHVGVVNPVACRALGVSFADGHVGQPMKARELGYVVAAETAGIGQHLAGVRFVTLQALRVTARAIGELFLVAARAGHGPCELMDHALMAPSAARMPHILAG